jgi:hypothetical protein
MLAHRFYSEASSGRLDAATNTLRMLEAWKHDGSWMPGYREVLLEADRGLLAFRRGDIVTGATHYRNAIAGAAEPSLRTAGALATLNFAFEAARLRVPSGIDEATLEELVAVFDETNREVVRSFVARIRRLRMVLPASAATRITL